VTSIGVMAFTFCSGLASVTVNATTPPTLGSSAFNGTAAALKIYVPAESVDDYKTAWSAYADKIEAIGGGSTPSGLQVTELQVPASWQDNPTMLSTSDMPGFVAITEAEAKAWDAAPAGNVVLIFAFEGDGATSLSFKNGVYQASQAHNITYEDLYGWSVLGRQIFYTGGGSTPAGTVTVVFEANNNQKEVEVTLPHTFACDFENGNGELDGIIQELYALQYGGYCQAFTVPTATGNAAVTASKDGNNHYIAISEAFEGTATVTGNYIKFLDTEQMGNSPVDYTLTISAAGGGSTPTSSETTVTWDLSDMASMGTQGGYFKAKGITLMAYGVDNGMTGEGMYGGAYFGGPFVFTTSLGKFTKIEVTNSYLYEQPAFSGDDWTLDGTNAVWEGTPAALVSLVSNFGGITQIKFTIDPNTSTPANSCGTV